MRRLMIALAALATLCHVTALSHAAAHPWTTIGDDDIRLVSSPELDVNLRVRLIDRAQDSIDVAVYDLRPDDAVTYPILKALRRAADRGVRIRILTSYLPQFAFDRMKTLSRFLLNPPTRVPIRYLVIGGLSFESRDWGALDTVHEKLFLVDSKRLLVTGRGFGENYLHWLDSDYAIKGSLVIDAMESFNDAWASARRVRSLTKLGVLARLDFRPVPASHRRARPPALSAAEATELTALLSWFDDPTPTSERRYQARLLHHDFLKQMREQPLSPVSYSIGDRLARLDDCVVDAVVARLATAREARLTILSTILHPKLREALLKAAARGAAITILTNVTAPELGGFAKHVISPGGPLWHVEQPDLDALLSAGIDVRGFQTSASTPWVYLHRKLAIIDDVVIFGSHNLNIPSTTNNDEISFEVVNPEFAARQRAIFDGGLVTNSMPLDPAQIHANLASKWERLTELALWPFIGIL